MTRDDIVGLLAERQRLYDRRDPKALAATHAIDGTVHSPLFPTIVGRDAIETSYASLFKIFPDWQIFLEDPIIDGARAVQPFTARATHQGEFMGLPGSGRRFEIGGALFYLFEGSLVLQERRIYDFTGLLMQIGVLRGKPAK
jgi:predicted ester cyclase